MISILSRTRLVFLLCVPLALSACTTSKDIRTAQKQLRSVQDFRRVDMKAVAEPLSEYRKADEDEVLFHLEHGMLAHFQEQWNQSDAHFQRAERAIDRHFSKSISRNVGSMLVNDLQLAYHGEAYEDIYLNAVTSLNYLHQDDLEGAMVEARKVTHKLEQLSDRYKGLAESVSQDTAQTAVKKVDQRLEDVDLLDQGAEQAPVEVEQNSALGRFLTTVLYAKTGSRDDARIERRKLRTALQDQGNTGFLTALSEGRDTTSTEEQTTKHPSTAMAVRLGASDSTPPPGLTIRVRGAGTYTIPADSFQRREDTYAARIDGVPAEKGDSISIRPDATLRTERWLEVWSDSLQYRASIGGASERPSFVLGNPRIRTLPDERLPMGRGHTSEKSGEGSLTPTKLSYAVTRATTTGRKRRTLVRTIRHVPFSERRGWQVVEHSEPMLGAGGRRTGRTDTVHLAPSTLRLNRYSQQAPAGDTLTVRREDNAIIEAPNDWHTLPAKTRIDRRAYGEGMGLEVALAGRSYSVGEVFSLPVYVSSLGRVESIEVQVLGTDSVSTPAGRYGAYEVRLIPPAPHQGTARLFLRQSAPHHVVQARLQMPTLTSGRRDTLVLTRTLTKIEDRSPALSERPRRAQRQAPPSDLPTVTVDPDTTPGMGTASGRRSDEAGLLPQLTRSSTYNTMLISFSGQAPIKRERAFSFNFTIQEEEFQLDFAIPVLETQGTYVDRVRAIASGDTLRVPLLEQMESVAEAMFDEKKSIIYTRAVIRSFLKAGATKGVQKLAENQGNEGMAVLAKEVGQMASQYVAQADTRGWQTMPGFAYATVTTLPPGTHEVTFEFLDSGSGVLKRRTRKVEVRGTDDLALAESIYFQ